jgi:glycerophosphoryl diester phosphodiesterase
MAMLRWLRLVDAWIRELFRSGPCPDGKLPHGMRTEPFLVIAHRGSPTVEIENTIPSFTHALERDGANGIELDLCMTADGVIVVWHDWDPDDSIAKLRERGYEPDVKYRPCPPEKGDYRKPVHCLEHRDFLTHFGFALKEGNGGRVPAEIPTFDHFMRWASGRSELQHLFLDIKIPAAEVAIVPEFMDRVEEIIERYHPGFRIIFETMEKDVLMAMKSYRPDNFYTLDISAPPGLVLDPAACSCANEAICCDNRYATPQRPRQSTVAPWTTYRRVIEHDLRKCMEHNSSNPDACIERLIGFTINDPEEMRCLIRMGLSGIQTDRPGLLRQVADQMGLQCDPLQRASTEFLRAPL